ncbi:MAG: 50S ribosomal protein L28 [Pseudomonadota bacterium]
MSRRCELTGKSVMVGNNVSHANNKTKRRFLPNLQSVRFFSESLGRFFRFRVTVNAVRSVDKNGGIDGFLLKAKKDTLSLNARKLQKIITEAKQPSSEAA